MQVFHFPSLMEKRKQTPCCLFPSFESKVINTNKYNTLNNNFFGQGLCFLGSFICLKSTKDTLSIIKSIENFLLYFAAISDTQVSCTANIDVQAVLSLWRVDSNFTHLIWCCKAVGTKKTNCRWILLINWSDEQSLILPILLLSQVLEICLEDYFTRKNCGKMNFTYIH